MVSLSALWLPVLVSAVLVYVVSSLFWMVVRHHEPDWKGLPGEDGILAAFRAARVPKGQYRFPYAAGREMQSPEMKKKMAEGPAGFLVYWDRWEGGMGKNLVVWFLYLLGVAILVGYLAGRVLPPGTPFAPVFRVAGTAAFLGFAGAVFPNSIWWGRSWSSTFKDVFDGLVYALVTAGVFGWLWPR
jgi:hypothetical protein